MKELNGTFYHDDTPDEVIAILDRAMRARPRPRLRFFFGSEGRCWNEENDVLGMVGRSTGTQKIPLLVYNARSLGGGSILTDRIIRIDDAPGHTIYEKPGYRFDTFVSIGIGFVYNETREKLYARCKSEDAGRRLAAFMNGKRWAK